jgi:uncharacterized membrane protein YhaH (DUF805 family)
MEWMLMPLKRYFQFSGRARRKEYWMYVLFLVLVSAVLQTVESILGLQSMVPNAGQTAQVGVGGTGPISGLFGLAVFIPSLAVTFRRLHDTNRSGWWAGAFFLLYAAIIGIVLTYVFAAGAGRDPFQSVGPFAAIGIIGLAIFLLGIVLLVFMCLDGTSGPNRFGPDPKGAQNLGDVFA